MLGGGNSLYMKVLLVRSIEVKKKRLLVRCFSSRFARARVSLSCKRVFGKDKHITRTLKSYMLSAGNSLSGAAPNVKTRSVPRLRLSQRLVPVAAGVSGDAAARPASSMSARPASSGPCCAPCPSARCSARGSATCAATCGSHDEALQLYQWPCVRFDVGKYPDFVVQTGF